MALWVVSRNALERTIPDLDGSWQHSKHFLCGGIAGLCVQLPTFPFDTLKKRLQSAVVARGVLGEVRVVAAMCSGCVQHHAGATCLPAHVYVYAQPT